MLAYWRTYLVVGGMPEVVQAFLDSDGDLARVREIQTDLVKGYQRDIAKYAGRRALNVRAIFDQLPLQLDNDSRRFVLNSIDDEARYEAYRQDFVWIVNAGVGLKTNLVREPRHPLEMTKRPGMFKLYQSDTGMLVSRYPMQTARDIYLDSKSPNLGGVYENALAQELVCGGYDLFYYMGKKRGEVDFVIENDAGAVVPVESKSSRNARAHASLNNLLATEEYALDLGVVFSRLNVERRGKVLYLPWYAVPFIGRAIGGGNEVDSWNLRMTLPIL
jgi:predicted AAA+ superfamily ATPase